MTEIIAYEMKLNKSKVDVPNIACIPFQKQYFEEYKRIYNECFYDMRKALNIEPYHFLHDYEQIVDKVEDIYLLVDKEVIIGSVACYRNEIAAVGGRGCPDQPHGTGLQTCRPDYENLLFRPQLQL